MKDEWIKLLDSALLSLHQYGWTEETRELCFCILDAAVDLPIEDEAVPKLHTLLSFIRVLGVDEGVKFLIRVKELECKLIRLDERRGMANQEKCAECNGEELTRNPENAIYRDDAKIKNRYKIMHRDNGIIQYIEEVTEYVDGTKSSVKEYAKPAEAGPPLYNFYGSKILEDDIVDDTINA